ncbi:MULTISPECIES: hypothetical protein [Pseudomonas]|uniref:Phage tail protein n=1 Tax=Pseudomonas tritici TaxID=2745518 RepID=A0A8H9YQV9_9PSED|nr:hypothetical protein [Pseudomonas tritici]MBP2871163.1 hypothetical protein [Pseudomonas sp. SWRI144]QXH83243.1 hypothetical protein HU722_0025260 [Pseudomonas tritici]
MDFPKSVPSVGLVDGKFIDEDAVAGTPGSLIPSAWGNAVTLEMIKVIEEAGLTPDEDDNTQLNAAIDLKISESSVEFASQPEAEAGESSTKAMSPLRVFQAIAKVITQATESAYGWIKIATQSQINAGASDLVAVTPKKLASVVQVQSFTAFSTGGTAAALTLTPVPAITTYAPNQRFQVGFSVASAGGDTTINVSGLGPKLLKQYNSAGVKVPAVFAQWQIADVVYDSVDFVLLDVLPTTTANLVGIRGAALNLRVSATGTDSVIAITADELQVENAAGQFITLRNVSCTASFAVAGAGGLAVGAANSQLASTLYYVHVIWDGTAPKGWLTTDVNPATPLPGAFTHRARVSRDFTDATGSKFPLSYLQKGRNGQYVVGGNVAGSPRLISGISGNPVTPTWTPVPLAPFLAPTDAVVYLGLYNQGASTQTTAAPNNAYGAVNSATNMPMCNISNSSANSNQNNFLMRVVPESSNVYYASNATVSHLSAFGWEDSI